ncbi:esterase [Lithospermum erythrorhizon]|uniref:pectinesterase n=1 Tax=Lithospermum erythrorhizon TaxID=34254 RepID=A0AAV3RVI5_LITER
MLAKNMNITLLAFLPLLFPVIAIPNINTINKKAYTIINSTCASTLYPDLCISSLTSPSPPPNITTTMDVVMASLNHTISTIQFNKITINKIAKNNSLTVREKTALQDCNKTADESLYELKKVKINLHNYTSKNHSANDLLTLLSAAMTNQETCIDGFSHDEASRIIRSGFLAKQFHAYKLCSNILAMVKNMTDSSKGDEIGDETESNNAGHDEWPKWLSAGNRKLLQQSTMVIPKAAIRE